MEVESQKPVNLSDARNRIGMAKGAFTCCEDIDFCNDEVLKTFESEANSA